METLLTSGVPTSYLIKMLIKKQQKRSFGTPAKGLFSGGSSRQEAAVWEALPTSCLPLALPLTTQPLSHSAWHETH